MKNKIVSFICLVSMLALMAPAMGAMAEDAIKVPSVELHDDSFLYEGSALQNDNDTSAQRNSIKLDSGIEFSEYAGFVDTVDNLGKGNSLRIGITEEANSASNLSVNIPIPNSFYTTGESGNFTLEMDVYIDSKTDFVQLNKPYGNAAFYTQFYGPVSSYRKRALVWDQKLYTVVDSSNELSTQTGYDYSAQKWYKTRLEVKWTPNGNNFDYLYDAYVSVGENDEMVKVLTDEPAMRGASKITQIRFYAPILKDNPTWAAIDNIVLYGRDRDMPVIKSLAYGDSFTEITDGGTVEYSAEKIGINLTDYIESVEDGDVLLYLADGDNKTLCPLSATEYDKDNYRIIITPESALSQKANYEIVLTENIEVSLGTDMPIEQTATFVTTEEPIVNNPVADSDFLYRGSPLTSAAALTSGTTLDSGIVVSKGSGYALSTVIDAARGTGLKLGIGATGTDMPRVDVPITDLHNSGQSGSVRLDLDYYIGEMPEYSEGEDAPSTWLVDRAFRLGFNGLDAKALYWYTKMKDNYGGYYSYKAQTWYKATLYLSWIPQGTQFKYSFDVYIGEYTGAEEPEMSKIGGTRTISSTGLITDISFYAPKKIENEKEVWAALDNISLSTQKPIPDIAGFEAFDDIDAFSAAQSASPAVTGIADKNLVAVYLTESIVAATESQVSLTQSGIDVPVEKIGYDSGKNAILLLLTNALKENTAYTFEMSEDVEVWSGVPMGRTRSKNFTTTTSGAAVTLSADDITFSGTTATVNAQAFNVSDTAKKVYLIVSVWDGNKFIAQQVEAETAPAATDSQALTVSVSGVETGYTVYVYAWNNVFGAEMLTNKIVSKINN